MKIRQTKSETHSICARVRHRGKESRVLKQRRQWNRDRRNKNATTTKAQRQQRRQQQKALAAAAVASTISISSTQAMRLGAIKSNHFVLITYCEQRQREQTDEFGWEMKIHASWEQCKRQTHLASKTIDFRAENWWKLAFLQFVLGCAERADLIVRCELWWSLLLLLLLLPPRCYCRYCRHIANGTVKINKGNEQMSEHFMPLLLNHHAIV